MSYLGRHATTLCVAVFAALLWPKAGRAWVESEVRSQLATVDVDRAGSALVTEDLTFAVRGGPFTGFELGGVDLDAVPLPGAMVSSLSASKSELDPTPLLVDRRDDGTLRIEVDRERGLRTGTYLFHLQYRTDLLARQLIRRQGREVEVRWVGPRFTQGIDSARAIFRLPAAPVPPSLPDADASAGRLDDGDALGGVFIGNLRRLTDKDELEIVRPHVSRGEPVVWRALVSPKAFDAFAQAVVSPPRAGREALNTKTDGSSGPRERLRWWLGALALAIVYALALSLKWRLFSAICRTHGATARAPFDLPIGLRAALSGSLLSAAFVTAAWFERSTCGAVLLVSSMALAGQWARADKARLRGPGRWLPLSDADAFARARDASASRWLDAGTVFGAASLAACLAASVVVAQLTWARSPYQSLLVLIGAACWAPLFFTGRAAELPLDASKRPRPFLARLAKRLRRATAFKVVPWARIPDGAREADELRLLLQVPSAVRGLLGIEIGLEYRTEFASARGEPFVLVRAREGSEAVRALPRSVTWTRGRKADERAAILRPRFPTEHACATLVLELAKLLQVSKPAPARAKRELAPDGGTLSALRVRSPDREAAARVLAATAERR